MSNYILTRIEAIQQELEILKQKVLTQEHRDSPDRVPKLRGIWKDVEISDQLLEDVERSLIAKDFRAGID